MSRLLVTGAAGQLGRELVRLADLRGIDVAALDRNGPDPCDLTDRAAVFERVERDHPRWIVHAAAWAAADDCELDPEQAMEVNGEATRHVADAADAVGAHVLYVSTDYVFDGTKPTPYVEDDEPNPLSWYGRSKLAGERMLAPSATIARTSWVSGEFGSNMVKVILRLAAGPGELRFVDDQVGHPTFTSDLAPVLLDLALEEVPGTFHVTNQGAVSWYGFAREVLQAAGHDPDRVIPIATSELDPPRPAPRPANSRLENRALRESGRALPRDFREPLAELVAVLLEHR